MKLKLLLLLLLLTDSLLVVGQDKDWFKKGLETPDPVKKIEYYTNSIDADGATAVTYNNRGTAYRSLKEYDKALADFTSALQLNPLYFFAYKNRGNVYNYDLKQYDLAIMDYSKAIEYNPGYTAAWYDRGNAYRSIQQYSKAIADFSKVIELDPKYANAYDGLGSTYVDLQQYDKALADFSKAIELDPGNISGYIGLSLIDTKKADYDAAIQITKKGILQNPREGSLYDNIGYLYLEKSDTLNAVSSFKKCLELDNKNFDALLGLAICSQANLNNTRYYLDEAKKLEPRLYKGMDGIAELEKDGYPYSVKKKASLKKLFDLLK